MILNSNSITMPFAMTRQQNTKPSPNGTSQPSGTKRPQRRRRPQRGVHRKPEKIFTFTEADDRIYDFFKNHGFGDYPHEKRHELVKFYEILMHEQHNQNITRLLTIRDVAIKHFIDCLMITRLTELKFPLLDIGTGAGFPGIPLKIHYPDEPILLSEGVQKRVEFLKQVREKMHLQKLDIIGRNINPTFVYPIKGAITRAVEDMNQTLGSVINALQLDGEVYFMKGPNLGNEIERALKEFGDYYELKANIAYELPNTPHKRRLVIFRKKAHPPPLNTNKIIDEDYED